MTELDKKLNEECAEYQADKSIEELADMLEVMYAIAKARGWSVSELEAVRREKAEKRGALKARYSFPNGGILLDQSYILTLLSIIRRFVIISLHEIRNVTSYIYQSKTSLNCRTFRGGTFRNPFHTTNSLSHF